MNASLVSRFIAAVSVCLGIAQAAVAHDSTATETASVWIFSDRYISAEKEFSNSEPLDARVRSTLPQVVRLDLCEPSAPHLLLTAYLFRDFHVEIRPLTAEHSACTVETTARVVRVAISQPLAPHEDKVVDQYWRGLMP